MSENGGHCAEHARSLVSMVKESSSIDQKSTMLQLAELWRSQNRKSGIHVRTLRILSIYHCI